MRLSQPRRSEMFALLLGAAMTGTAWSQYVGDAFDLGASASSAAEGVEQQKLLPRRRGFFRPEGRRFWLRRDADVDSTSAGTPLTDETQADTPRLGIRLWARSLAAMRRMREAAQARQAESLKNVPTAAEPTTGQPTEARIRYFGPERSVLQSADEGGVVIEMGTPDGAEPIGSGVGPTLAPPTTHRAAPQGVPNFDVQINIPPQ